MDRRSFLRAGSCMGLGMALGSSQVLANAKPVQIDSKPAGVITPEKIENVRIGIVGMGVRGFEFSNIFMDLGGNEIVAVCDIVPGKVAQAQKMIRERGHKEPKGYAKGENDFVRMCENEEMDLVIAATPVHWHVPVCVAAMKNGSHSATEVHATYELDECWELVEAAEKYNRQCALLENYCYLYNVMMVLKMARMGAFGELVFSESGYLHDVRPFRFGSDGSLLWRAKDMLTHNGNLYPTHAIGPVAQWFNINRGDRFDHMVSMSSRSSGMNVYAREKFGEDHPSAKQVYTQGDISCTMIKTAKGSTFTLYFDAQLPRPFNMIYKVQGTKGMYLGTTDNVYLEGKSPYDQWEPASKYKKEYEHPLWTQLGDKARPYGHWGGDYLMMYRLIKAFHQGQLVDIDVYDATSWSVISPLSEISVANKSKTMDFPDFTRGKWKTNEPLGIIEA